jgi:hypothetical protein
VVGSAGTAALDVVLFLSAILPVIVLALFAWWFLRAGRRYDERERAAGRRPPA